MKDQPRNRLSHRLLVGILATVCVAVAFAGVVWLYLPDFRGSVVRERAESGMAVHDRHVIHAVTPHQQAAQVTIHVE